MGRTLTSTNINSSDSFVTTLHQRNVLYEQQVQASTLTKTTYMLHISATYICDIYVTYMWHICDIYVIYMWHICGRYVTYMLLICQM